MSKETNNEIDLLLRRIGRDHEMARSVAARADDRHLDTDELSSYAQNALPAAARARYTEHLAECVTCRKLVTELSLSLGAAVAPIAAAHEPSGLKRLLASLLSPLVLRYAVPALGVIVVMVVGFVVLRQQRRQGFVAQLGDNPEATVTAPSNPAPPEGLVDKDGREIDKLDNGNPKSSETKRKTEDVGGNASAVASASAPAPAPVTKDGAINEVKPAVAATPAAAAPAKAADTAGEPGAKTDAVAKKQEEQPKAKPADEDAQAPAPMSTRGLSTLEPAGRTTQNAAKPGSSDTHGFMGGVAASRPQAAAKRAERAEAEKRADANRAEAQDVNNETRTIAGRRFRKQGGIWTDTAYDSSTATVNMARNSEQFRALVADEPAIGTIAKQLEGEVIVVWKGRAYHIR